MNRKGWVLASCMGIMPQVWVCLADKRTFRKTQPAVGGERSFVQFILEPLYKIYAQVRVPTDASNLLLGALIPAAHPASVWA